MLRNALIVAVILTFIFGCRPPITSTGIGGSFGSNSVIVKEVFDSALGGYRLEGAELRSSGSESNEGFSLRGSVTVKEARQIDVANLLDKQLEILRASSKWTHLSSSRDNDNYLGFNYEENSGKFFLDFILTQKDKDVHILVLSKGVRD